LHTLKLRYIDLIEEGKITKEEGDSFFKFVDMQGVPSMNLFIYGKLGQLKHLEKDPGYQAT